MSAQIMGSMKVNPTMATIMKTTRATVNAMPAVLVFSTYQLQYFFASGFLNQNNVVADIQ